MIVSMIAAMADKRVIGADNAMPWHMPADLAHFKRTTMGKPVIMGRKTYDSIGKALPGRTNIVISRDKSLQLPDAVVARNCDAAIKAVGDVEEVMIIGGGSIYEFFLPVCDRLYLTEIDLVVAGDTYFPDFQSHGEWNVISQTEYSADEKNQYAYRFITWQRRDSQK